MICCFRTAALKTILYNLWYLTEDDYSNLKLWQCTGYYQAYVPEKYLENNPLFCTESRSIWNSFFLH